MIKTNYSIFRRLPLLIFGLITLLGLVFITITYLAITHYHEASTQLLNREVASHIAKFTSPFDEKGIDKKKADSVFYDAMVLSPSVEVYFLDSTGRVIAFHGPENEIRLWKIPLENIQKYLAADGNIYIKVPDPRQPSDSKIFSAAEVNVSGKKLGYIFVILGSRNAENIMNILLGGHLGNLVLEAMLIIILLSAAISIFYTVRVRNSFNQLIGVIQQFEKNDYTARFTVKRNDDLAPVMIAFNNMADLLNLNIDKLTRSEKDRRDFMANISHDLRTPLSIARGYSETLLIKKAEGNIPAVQLKEYVELIVLKIGQVEEMVQQVFELSKIEAAEFQIRKEPFVLAEIVQELVNGFQLSASSKKIQLRCVQCQHHTWIMGDVRMIERVIQNLIDNALKNTPDGGTIDLAIMPVGRELNFSIENSGKELPAELLLWVNTYRGENAHLSERPSQLGLGLLIVQKILMLHGTQLQASSDGAGITRFTFRLPLHDMKAAT